MEGWEGLVRDLGFPIAVASFVLFRLNGKVGENTSAIRENTEAILRLSEAHLRPARPARAASRTRTKKTQASR